MAEGGECGLPSRGPLRHDRHRDQVEPRVLGEPCRGRPARPHGICGEKVDLFFILGADAFAQIFTWRDVNELFTFAHFVGCSRVGYQLADPGVPSGSVSLVEISGLPISSSLIRRRVRAGQPIRYLVPDGVAQYISQRGLYRDGIASPTATGDCRL